LVDELHLLGATPQGGKLVNQARTERRRPPRTPHRFSISTAPIERSEGIFQATKAKAQRVIAGKETDPSFFRVAMRNAAGARSRGSGELALEQPQPWLHPVARAAEGGLRQRAVRSIRDARLPVAELEHQPRRSRLARKNGCRWRNGMAAADITITLEALIAESRTIYVWVAATPADWTI
jgi:hypothetical protein